MNKKIILMTAIFLIGVRAFGQLSPLMPYGNHDISEIRVRLFGTSPECREYRKRYVVWMQRILHDTLNFSEKNIAWSLQFFQSREVNLPRGSYINTGWDKKRQVIDTFPGDLYEKFAWEFHCGSYGGVSIKQNCGNIILIISFAKTGTGISIPPGQTSPGPVSRIGNNNTNNSNNFEDQTAPQDTAGNGNYNNNNNVEQNQNQQYEQPPVVEQQQSTTTNSNSNNSSTYQSAPYNPYPNQGNNGYYNYNYRSQPQVVVVSSGGNGCNCPGTEYQNPGTGSAYPILVYQNPNASRNYQNQPANSPRNSQRGAANFQRPSGSYASSSQNFQRPPGNYHR